MEILLKLRADASSGSGVVPVFFSTNIVEILLKRRADASSGSGAVKAILQGSSSPSPSPSPSSSLLFSIFA